MRYALFIDDNRMLGDVPIPDLQIPWTLARSSGEAKGIVLRRGIPAFISFDHDLGGDDTSMVFLKWFSALKLETLPEYQVHSANPVGKENIISFMESWKRSLTLPNKPIRKPKVEKTPIMIPPTVKLSHIRDRRNPRHVLTLARDMSLDRTLIAVGFSVNRVTASKVEQFNRKEGNRLALERLEKAPLILENEHEPEKIFVDGRVYQNNHVMIEVHPLKVIRDGICSMTRAQLAASQIPFAVQDILLNERLFIGGNPTDAPRKYNG